MIELKFTGKCEGCKYANLELVPVALGKEKLWGVRCIHDYACEAMLKKSLGERKDG